jgi:hypothetical protein
VLVDPESLRMLIFGLALVLVMRFKPAGLWPSPERKRELTGKNSGAAMSATREVLLGAQAVAKHFGGVKALRDVSLNIRKGDIYGLIGPNGAGKTTFFNCMTGLYVPDGGGFVFDGTPLKADAPHKAAERGIARTFQNIRLFGNMTALDNVMVGRHVRTRSGVFGAMLRNRAARRPKRQRFGGEPKNCCITSVSKTAPTTWPRIFPMAISAASKSPGRWLLSRNCSVWMSRRRV